MPRRCADRSVGLLMRKRLDLDGTDLPRRREITAFRGGFGTAIVDGLGATVIADSLRPDLAAAEGAVYSQPADRGSNPCHTGGRKSAATGAIVALFCLHRGPHRSWAGVREILAVLAQRTQP